MKQENSKSIREVIALFIREQGLEEGLLCVRVYEAWDAVCGERVAVATLRKYYKNKILYCTLNSSMLRNRLYPQKGQLLDGINKRLQAPLVKDIVLK